MGGIFSRRGIGSTAIAVHSTSVSTTAVTTEETLWTDDLEAGLLGTDGDSVRITAWGTTAATANNKTIRIKFGTTSLTVNNATAAPNGASWRVNFIVTRTGAGTQTIMREGLVSNVPQVMNVVAGTSNDAAAITMSVTGQPAVATAGEITLTGVIVEHITS